MPMSYNPWLYADANPINKIDPKGQYPTSDQKSTSIILNPVVKFIVQRINEDSNSEAIKRIYRLNNTNYYSDACDRFTNIPWYLKRRGLGWQNLYTGGVADATARTEALRKFGCLVADGTLRPVCGQWDYKVNIEYRWGNAQKTNFMAIGKEEEVVFYYDIWANIHFGYLGRVGGFSENELLRGAAIEHAGSNPGQFRDDPSDIASTKIGFRLYSNSMKAPVTEQSLLWQIYFHKDELNKAVIKKGGNRILRVYR